MLGDLLPRGISRREWMRRAAIMGIPLVTGVEQVRAAALAAKPSANRGETTPDWIAPGKLRWVWALWEPLDMYRRGGFGAGVGDGRATGHWVGTWYRRMHSDEILDKLAAAGVNLVSTHFYKGFGLKAEAEEMARATDFTRRAHARGIRVLGYHQFSTVIYETLLDEIPHLADWIQRGPDGKLETYGSAYWRWKACPIHDGFIAYLKQVIDRCLIDADMDGVEYDGTSYDCHCDACTAAFRRYLAEHCPRPRERFGLPHFRNVRIPSVRNPKDPLWQERVRFAIDLMGRRLRELRAYVHQKKPGAALVTYEDCPALWRKDRTRLLPDQGDYLDLAIAENHEMPQVLRGELVTKVRHLKEGTAIGQVALSTDWLRSAKGSIALPSEPKPVELDMAESLACGGHVLAATWALRSGDRRDGAAFFEQPAFYEAMRRYMGFAREHESLYLDSQPCANVWIYHSPWSLAFDHGSCYPNIVGFEQALLGRIAYRVAKPAHLAGLGPRDVLIVANQTCLGDDECAAIRAAVGRGCQAMITGMTAECDENFRQRKEPALTDLYEKPGVRYFADCPGKIRGASDKAMEAAMPKRAVGIVASVRKLARQPLAAELEGGDPQQPLAFVDVYRTRRNVVAHAVWYGDGPAQLKLKVGPWLAGGEATLHSPYLAKPQRLKAAADGWLALPAEIGRYAAVEMGGR